MRDAPQPLIEMPYTISEFGLMSVEARVNGAAPMRFLIDTGATRSVLSRASAQTLGLTVDPAKTTIVHGIFESQRRPLVRIESLEIAGLRLDDMDVVILDDDDSGTPENLIGVDILGQFVMEVDSRARRLRLHAAESFSAEPYRNWTAIDLKTNPYQSQEYGLYFAEAVIDGEPVPAIIDLGSAFSALNWEGARSGRLIRLRNRMKDKWQLSGANGEFNPIVVARYDFIRIESYRWLNQKLAVADLESLDILGANGRPLMLAGAPLFRNRDYVIDFSRLKMYLRRKPMSLQERQTLRFN